MWEREKRKWNPEEAYEWKKPHCLLVRFCLPKAGRRAPQRAHGNLALASMKC